MVACGLQRDGTDRMEDEARRRAVDGVEESVFYQGEQVSTVRRYSDTLLIFMLKARRPETYRERSDINSTIQGGITVTWEQ